MKHNTSIKSKELYAKFELTGHNHKIYAKISKGKITLNPDNLLTQSKLAFKFDRSNPKTIQAIAELMLEACYLHKDMFGED